MRRVALAALLGVGVMAFVLVSESWTRGEGMVVGELTAVNPISQMRVKEVLVKCLEPVAAGQVLAQLENELTMESARQQLEQLAMELDQARSTVHVAAKQAEAARQLYDARVAVRDQLQLVQNAQSKLVNDRYIASLAWQKSKADVARADAEAQAARFVHETKTEDRRRAEIRATQIEQRIESLRSSPELMGSLELRAPKPGFLTQCDARAGEVVDAATALFRIFNPDDAYAVVFLDPSDAARRSVGDRLQVEVDGIEGALPGVITGIYPQFSGLPEALTRYFWQQEKWSRFAPLRVQFDNLSTAQRAALRASARVYVSTWELPSTGIAAQLARALRVDDALKAAQSLIAMVVGRHG